MSARSDAFRGDGLTFPVFFAAGSTPIYYVPVDTRLDRVYVKTSTNPTTINILVNGSSVLANTTPTNYTVAASSGQLFKVSSQPVLQAGTSFQVTSTDGAALISVGFGRA